LGTWGCTGLLVGTCRRDGGDGRRGFGVDMVRRPSLGMVTIDGHEIFKIDLKIWGSVPTSKHTAGRNFPPSEAGSKTLRLLKFRFKASLSFYTFEM
jgi:hypothetical protein